jgi:cytochrome c
MKLARIALVLGCCSAGGIVLSTIHPWGNPRTAVNSDAPLLETSDVPGGVRSILEEKCADCHSERTKYPIYTRVAPITWMIDRDVSKAREALNMSRWQNYSASDQISELTKVASEVHSGEMPPGRYLLLHPQARLSATDQQLVYDWAKAERKRLRVGLSSKSNSPEELKTR